MRARGRMGSVAVCLLACAMAVVQPAAAAPSPPGAWAPFSNGIDAGFGWARCVDPIVVSISTSPDTTRKRTREALDALRWAARAWDSATGLNLVSGGIVPTVYDDATGLLTPVDGVKRERHIYIAAIPPSQAPRLRGPIVGLAAPTVADLDRQEYRQGSVVFDRAFLREATVGQLRALFAHELGHALGLGHARVRPNVMYPTVIGTRTLGAGDKAGIQAITRDCNATPATEQYLGASQLDTWADTARRGTKG